MFYQEDDDLYAEKERRQKEFAEKNFLEDFAEEIGLSSEGPVDPEPRYWKVDEGKLKAIEINMMDAAAKACRVECDWTFGKKIALDGGGATFAAVTSTSMAKMEAALTEDQQIMIQTLPLPKSFDRVCIDSGAGESVCPVDAFPEYGTLQTNKVGVKYRAAGGQELEHVGETSAITTNGRKLAMTFQATTNVKKPLAAASEITAKGNRIVLDDAEHDSYIENKATGVKIPLRIENGVYMMEMIVDSPSAPFTRPAK